MKRNIKDSWWEPPYWLCLLIAFLLPLAIVLVGAVYEVVKFLAWWRVAFS